MGMHEIMGVRYMGTEVVNHAESCTCCEYRTTSDTIEIASIAYYCKHLQYTIHCLYTHTSLPSGSTQSDPSVLSSSV